MPVPIEMIVEQTYNLTIETRDLPEPPDTTILGALYQEERKIVLNERHQDLFDEVLGPFEFTVAHELAHWLYDADAGQGSLFDLSADHFCYHRDSLGLPELARIRETNANKLAAAVLMPADLVLAADLEDIVVHLREYARTWGVSRRALEIRLSELGVMSDGARSEQGLW